MHQVASSVTKSCPWATATTRESEVIGVATNLEQGLVSHLIRFNELDQHQSSFRPIDMALSRFDRRRFSVIGRPSEATSDSKSLNRVEAFNMVYVECDPGKGIGLHKHNTAEIFIPMTGMWEIGMGDDGESLVTLGPWDILNVPLNVMHSATNVSNAAAFLMVISTDQRGPEIFWDPKIIAEINEAGGDVSATEIPEGDFKGS